jgi:hypothetical protein
MEIAILNYATLEVIIEVYHGDDTLIEDYLDEKYGLDNIEYMTGTFIGLSHP